MPEEAGLAEEPTLAQRGGGLAVHVRTHLAGVDDVQLRQLAALLDYGRASGVAHPAHELADLPPLGNGERGELSTRGERLIAGRLVHAHAVHVQCACNVHTAHMLVHAVHMHMQCACTSAFSLKCSCRISCSAPTQCMKLSRVIR